MSEAAPRAALRASDTPCAPRVVWAVLAIAVLVRVPFLFGYGVDDDEYYTLRNAEDLFATPTPDAVLHFPVSFAVTRLFIALFGLTPLGLRAFPVLAGVLAVWLAARVGARIAGARVGMCAALVLAVWPWHQYFSGLSRYYAPLFLAALIVLDASWRVVREKQWGALPLGLAALVFGSLIHPTLPLSLGGAVGLRAAARSRGRSVVMPLLAILAVSAVLVAVAKFAPQGNPIVRVSSGEGGHGYNAPQLLNGLAFNVTTVVFTLAGLGAIALFGRDRSAFVFLVSASLLPIVTLLGLALTGGAVQPRYAMAGMPAIVLLAGVGVDALVPALSSARGRFVPALLACVAPLLPGVISNLADGDRHPIPAVAAQLSGRMSASDLLVAEGHSLLLTTLYGVERRHLNGEGDPPFPRFVGEWPPSESVLNIIDANRAGAWFVVPENLFAVPHDDEHERAAIEWLRPRAFVAARLSAARLDYHRNEMIVLRVPPGAGA